MILQINREKELNNRTFIRLTYPPKVMDTTFVLSARKTMPPAVWTSTTQITPSFPHVTLEVRPICHLKDERLSSFSKTTKPTFTFRPFSFAHLDISCSCDKYSLLNHFQKF